MCNQKKIKKEPSVLVATGTMNAGGAESLIMEVLRRRSDRIRYILLIHYENTRTSGMYDEEIASMGVPTYYIHSVGSVGEKRYTSELSKIVEEIGWVDIIHSHLNAVGGIIAKAAKIAGIKNRIVHCHADITYNGSFIYRHFSEIKLQYMKAFVKKYATEKWACSSEAAIRLFNTTKDVEIIPNVIHVADYLPDESKKTIAKKKNHTSAPLVLGSVGRITRIKNFEFSIRIISQLIKNGVECEYVCFGRITDTDYYNELVKLAGELGVTDYVHFLGNSAEVPMDIQCIDLFLMPSISEGFGMAALEAQAAGIPVIASTGIPRIVDMGLELVSFLPIERAEDWVKQIREMKRTPIESEKIMKAFDERGYNSDTMVAEIEKKYMRILSDIDVYGEKDEH